MPLLGHIATVHQPGIGSDAFPRANQWLCKSCSDCIYYHSISNSTSMTINKYYCTVIKGQK